MKLYVLLVFLMMICYFIGGYLFGKDKIVEGLLGVGIGFGFCLSAFVLFIYNSTSKYFHW